MARRLGVTPLPPYIRRPVEASDGDAYQTVYARVDGSVAAPTAGLHFTSALLERLARRGIGVADVVLHVGPGTFTPVREADPRRHQMDWERFEVERRVVERCDAAHHQFIFDPAETGTAEHCRDLVRPVVIDGGLSLTSIGHDQSGDKGESGASA